MGWCAPGTGANMLQVLPQPFGSSWAGAVGAVSRHGAPINCSWSEVQRTNIPDAGARTCAAALPADFRHASGQRGGGIWLIANSAESRLTLVLSTSPDGMRFDQHWVVRDRTTVHPLRFDGHGKSPGFQYPAGMWRGEQMVIVYSEGKENISATVFPLPSG